MLQTTQRLLAIPQLRPLQRLGALQTWTLGTPSRISAKTRTFHSDMAFLPSMPRLTSTRLFPHSRAYHQKPLQPRDYYGPVNMMLLNAFAPESAYTVNPGCAPTLPGEEYEEHVNFIVTPGNAPTRPVLIVDIQDETWLDQAELRVKVDERMRRLMEIVLWDCPRPHLWGMSLLGMSMRVYKGDVATRTITPAFQGRPDELPHDFLAEGWTVDLSSPEAVDRLQEITVDILSAPLK